jgi:TPR repeat protein
MCAEIFRVIVRAAMTNVGTTILVALCVSMVGSHGVAKAQTLQPLAPKAAQQYASDSEEAAHGDPEAAYRMGESLESGRLGGLKDLAKALKFYRLAAEKGHQQAAARVDQIEAELSQSQKKEDRPPTSSGH